MSRSQLFTRLRQALRSRHARFTAESFRVDPGLNGLPLSGVVRRAVAILLDLAFCVVLVIPLFVALLNHTIHSENPALPGVFELAQVTHSSPRARELDRVLLDLAMRNTPENLPPDMALALASADSSTVDSLREHYGVVVMLFAVNKDIWRWREGRPIHLSAFSLLGARARTYGLVSVIMVYFTLLSWLMRGRTPGKWLFGIRVLKINGGSLRLWDAFGRAGGYSQHRDPDDRFSGSLVGAEPNGPARSHRGHRGGAHKGQKLPAPRVLQSSLAGFSEAQAGIRERWAGRRITALFEPRSNTTVTRVMQPEFQEALAGADRVVLGPLHRPWKYPPDTLFDFTAAGEYFAAKGITFLQQDDVTLLPDWLEQDLQHDEVWVIFSNGSFNGLRDLLKNRFGRCPA